MRLCEVKDALKPLTPEDQHLYAVFSLNDHCKLPMPLACPVIPTVTSMSSPLSHFESQVVPAAELNKPRLPDIKGLLDPVVYRIPLFLSFISKGDPPKWFKCVLVCRTE